MLWVLIRSTSLKVFLMSTHNVCFHGEIRKKYHYFLVKEVPYQKLCLILQDPPGHAQSPLASHGLDDTFLKSPSSDVVMRKTNIRKSNTVAYRGDRDRPNKWKRASINGHIYDFDVSKNFQRGIKISIFFFLHENICFGYSLEVPL